jgi:hypothetical protein
MIRDALADAGAEGLRVEVADLGDWSPVRLISEYDCAARTIRVSAAALNCVRKIAGDDAAHALLAAAVAHELYHYEIAQRRRGCCADRAADERAAAWFARTQYGADPQCFERLLQ